MNKTRFFSTIISICFMGAMLFIAEYYLVEALVKQ